MRNVIWRTIKKYSIEALYQCAKIAQSLQRIIRPLFALGSLCFYASLNVFNLPAATKNLRTISTFLVKPKCVLLIGETRTLWQIFEVSFDYIRWIVTFINLFYCKTYTRDVFRTQLSICSKYILWFSPRSSTIDARQRSKYASAHIYKEVESHIIFLL